MMHPDADTDSLSELVNRLARALDDPITVYLSGVAPGAWEPVSRKLDTLDLLVASEAALEAVRTALMSFDYIGQSASVPGGQETRTFKLTHPGAFPSVGLSLTHSSSRLYLTQGIQSRTVPALAHGSVTIRTLSFTDQFLFYLLGGETADSATLADMSHQDVDFEVIRGELVAQILGRDDDAFITALNDSLATLVEQQGVSLRIEDRVWELASRYYRGVEVLEALNEPKTVDELATELNLSRAEITTRIRYLKEFDRVEAVGGTVRAVE